MIRVQLPDPEYRDTIAAFFRFGNLTVTYPEGDDALYIDFSAFDLNEEAQLGIVTRMLDAWRREHRGAVLAGAAIAIH
jgi:hypothetical protein